MTKYEWYDASGDTTGFGGPLGQSFTVGTTGTNENFSITSVKVKIYKVGSPGDVYVNLYAVDGNGYPTGSSLSSGVTDGDTLTTNTAGEEREITMSSYELQASTKYALVFETEFFDGSNMCRMILNSADASYTGGAYLYMDGEDWAEAAYDVWFEVYGEEVKSAILTETLSLSDGDNFGVNVLLSETISLTDNFLSVSLNEFLETLNLEDSLIKKLEIYRTFSETLNLTDSLTVLNVLAKELTETLGLSDGSENVIKIDLSESLILADILTPFLGSEVIIISAIQVKPKIVSAYSCDYEDPR